MTLTQSKLSILVARGVSVSIAGAVEYFNILVQMKRKLIQAFRAFVEHLNEPLDSTHPQIEFIPPMLFKLVFYAVAIAVVIGLISKAF